MTINKTSADDVSGKTVDGPQLAATSEPAPVQAGDRSLLPAPPGSASDDLMTLVMATETKNKDEDTKARVQEVHAGKIERDEAQKRRDEELKKAKEAKSGGFLGAVMSVVTTATDMAIGGNALQDLATKLSDVTGCKAFTIAYDVVRPDALLNAAAMLTSKATGADEIKDAYDMGAMSSSLQTRFQGAANATGEEDVMKAYDIVRQSASIAGSAAVAVGTGGAGTAVLVLTIVSASVSTAGMVESQFNILEKAGVDPKLASYIRLGATCTAIAAGIGAGALAASSSLTPDAAAKVTRDAQRATNVVTGSAKLATGAGQVDQAIRDKESSDHSIEADKAGFVLKRIDRQTDKAMTSLKEMTASYQRSLEALSGALQERNQSRDFVASRPC